MVDYTDCDTTLSDYMYRRRILYPTIEDARKAADEICEETPNAIIDISHNPEQEVYVVSYEINIDGYYSYIKIYRVYSK